MERVCFPFGEPLQKVEQKDRTPKKAFVLGVYASAVHAKWIDTDDKVKVNALVVASEPSIFWKGDPIESKQIIDRIIIPPPLGKIVSADERFNGPSGKVLDNLFLKPLGYRREDAWLCDLLPYSRINSNQQKAIERHYVPLAKSFNLPMCTLPQFNHAELKSPSRADEIVAELEESKADTLILLGDLPIKHFLSHFSDFHKLSDFGKTIKEYGKPQPIIIQGKSYQVIALVHPRQAGRLGRSNQDWASLHEKWVVDKKFEDRGESITGKIRVSKMPQKCPVCSSNKIAKYLYGMPMFSKKLENQINEGKVVLGGCCISGDDPFYACVDCKTDFYISTDN